MNKPLVLIGGGGHCKSVIDVAESAGYTILGILGQPEEVGKEVLAYKIIGTDDDIPSFVDDAEFVIAVGQIKNSIIRQKIASRIESAGGKYATIIASDAYVSKYAKLDDGCVVMHRAFVDVAVQIGKNCIINTMANIGHGVTIGDFCHVSADAMICGDCKIGNDVFVGSQSVLSNGIRVCDKVVIGIGSVIRHSIDAHGVYFGRL